MIEAPESAKVFVLGKAFQPSLIFQGKYLRVDSLGVGSGL